MLLGAVFKLIISVIFIPRIGILGAPLGTLACYFVIALAGLLMAGRHLLLDGSLKELFWTPFICGSCACLAGYPITYLPLGKLSTLLSLGTVLLAYVLFLILCGALRTEEIESLPIPKKIKKFIIKKESKYEKCRGIDRG